MIQFIRSEGKQGEAFSTNQQLGAYLKKREFAEPDEKLLVVFFSNGSFDGVIQEFVEFAESDFPPSWEIISLVQLSTSGVGQTK